MINQLTGKISHLSDKFLILNVSGVGFKVYISADANLSLSKKTDETITLWTHLSVKEDALDLYGFEEKEELEFFEKIISVSGIGPKKGLGIISIAPVKTLRKAIATKDISYLTQVSGIGRKNAEKIILELRDKMGEEEAEEGGMKEETDVIMAIKSLGYSSNEARKAIKDVPADIKGISNKIKWALKNMGK